MRRRLGRCWGSIFGRMVLRHSGGKGRFRFLILGSLVAPDTPVIHRELAYQVAAAQIDIMRVRQVRHEPVARTPADEGFETTWQRTKREMIMELRSDLPAASYARVMAAVSRKPDGEEKVVLVFSELTKRLLRLERYERCARSRRRKAIRAFDLAVPRKRGSSLTRGGVGGRAERGEMAERSQICSP